MCHNEHFPLFCGKQCHRDMTTMETFRGTRQNKHAYCTGHRDNIDRMSPQNSRSLTPHWVKPHTHRRYRADDIQRLTIHAIIVDRMHKYVYLHTREDRPPHRQAQYVPTDIKRCIQTVWVDGDLPDMTVIARINMVHFPTHWGHDTSHRKRKRRKHVSFPSLHTRGLLCVDKRQYTLDCFLEGFE